MAELNNTKEWNLSLLQHPVPYLGEVQGVGGAPRSLKSEQVEPKMVHSKK